MNASTFTVRVVASTGADVAAALSAGVGALSGPAARRRAEPRAEDARRRRARGRRRALRQGAAGPRRPADGLRPPRLPRRGPARPRAAAHEQGDRLAPLRGRGGAGGRRRWPSCKARKPDRVLATNVEFWSAVVLDHADVPAELFTSMFTCARVAGWSAHILEQKREGRLIRPSAKYVGPRRGRCSGARSLAACEPTGSRSIGLVREFKGGPRAVDGIDLEVAPGEIYGFLGPERRGQVDDRADAHDAAAADRGHGARGRPRHRARGRPRCAPRSAPRCRRRRSTRC